jgi:hypothetical protein
LNDNGRRDYTLNSTTLGPTNGVQLTQPGGNFRHDVEDQATISSDDIAISPDLPVPDDDGCVVCPTCETLVAQRFSGDRWGVNTEKGWLE